MSWMTDLVETYDICANTPGFLGRIDIYERGNFRGQLRPLAPIYHDIVKCAYEVHLDSEGDFLAARVLSKGEQTTIIPCTPTSRARTGVKAYAVPHALAERLDYITRENYRNPYMENFTNWVTSDSFKAGDVYAEELVLMVYHYLCRHTLADDISSCLSDDEKKGASPSGTVRFCIAGMAEEYGPADLSLNPLLWELHIARIRELQKDLPKDLCMATGTLQPAMEVGAKCILGPGDSAKIYPVNWSNEHPGTGYFTYRHSTIFTKPSDAFTVGADTAEKVQAMLRWLIDHQSWSILRTATPKMIVWAKHAPDAFSADDIYDPGKYAISEEEEESDGEDEELTLAEDDVAPAEDKPTGEITSIGKEQKENIRALSEGRWVKGFDNVDDEAILLTLDKPSIGRLSVVGYQKLTKAQYYETILKWHETAAWGDYFAPSVRQAVMTAYGDITAKAVGSDIKPEARTAAQQILRAINYGIPLPGNIADAAFPRTINTCHWKMSGSSKELRNIWYRYQRQVGLTCALICKTRKDNGSKDITMDALDVECKDRDYLYGRVLALLDALESETMRAQGREFERMTNAYKQSSSFYHAPARTTAFLMRAIQPYVKNNWPVSRYKLDEVNEILSTISKIEMSDPNHDPTSGTEKPLGKNAILGYACQVKAIKDARIRNTKAKKEREAQEKSQNA